MDLSKSSSIESLAKANHILKFEGGVERVTTIDYGGEFALRCMNCDEELATVMKVSDSPTKFGDISVLVQRFQGICPFCKDSKTWKVEVSGKVMIAHIQGKTAILNYEYGSFEENMLTTIFIGKK